MEANTVQSRDWRNATRPRPTVEEVAQDVPAPSLTATDPRWVLAVKTADVMQGPILPLEQRDRLIRLGKSMGLTAFDANLVLAIVQDQARRGHEPLKCPAEGIGQLAMVGGAKSVDRPRFRWAMAWMLVTALLIEAAVMWWVLG